MAITTSQPANWMDRLPVREGVVNGDTEDLVHMDWSQYWNPGPLDEKTPFSALTRSLDADELPGHTVGVGPIR